MWPILGILAASAVMIGIEVPSLVKSKKIKELWAFFIFLLFGTGLSNAVALGVKIANPLDWIQMIYKPVSDAIFSILK